MRALEARYDTPLVAQARVALELVCNAAAASFGAHTPLLRACAPLLSALQERRGRTMPKQISLPLMLALSTMAQNPRSRRHLEPTVWLMDAVVQTGADDGDAIDMSGDNDDDDGNDDDDKEEEEEEEEHWAGSGARAAAQAVGCESRGLGCWQRRWDRPIWSSFSSFLLRLEQNHRGVRSFR